MAQEKRMSEKQIIAEIERKLQEAIDNHSETIDLTDLFIYENGAYRYNTVNKEAVTKGIEKILSKIGIDKRRKNKGLSSITISGYAKKSFKNIRLASAFGRYFEYATYVAIEKLLKESFPNGIEGSAEIKKPSIQFILQQYAISVNKHSGGQQKALEMQRAIDQAAEGAAAWAVGKFGVGALEAVAGSDKTGDLILNNIILELKYYSDLSSINFLSFSDESMKFRNFKQFLIDSNNPKYWDSLIDNAPPENTDEWIDNLMTSALGEYWTQVVADKKNSNSLFYYLLQKGEKIDLGRKHLVLAQNTITTDKNYKVIITLDLESLYKMANIISSDYDGTQQAFIFLNQKKEEIGVISTNSNNFKGYSKTERKEPGKWTSTSFMFSLKQAFYQT